MFEDSRHDSDIAARAGSRQERRLPDAFGEIERSGIPGRERMRLLGRGIGCSVADAPLDVGVRHQAFTRIPHTG